MSLPQRDVYEWIEKFKNGRKSVTHEKAAGRPFTATSDDNTELTHDMLLIRLVLILSLRTTTCLAH